MIDISDFKLGETGVVIHLDNSDDHRLIARALVDQAVRTIDIFTHRLDRRVYDDIGFVDAVKSLAIGHSRAMIRILIQDSGKVAKEGHRLFNLGQEISSKIKFHNPSREHSDLNEAFMIVDHTGLLHSRQYDRYEGSACFNDPIQARELLAKFEREWKFSVPDPYLRRLSI